MLTGDDLASVLPDKTPEERDLIAADVEALAAIYTPCLADLGAVQVAQFKAIVRRAVAYDVEAGGGAVTSRSLSAGPFSRAEQVDTRQRQAGMLFAPAQIDALRALCGGRRRRAFSVSMIP